MAEKHPDYWEVACKQARVGEAQAKAQLAQALAQMAALHARTKDAELVAAMTAAGLDAQAQYTLEDSDHSITAVTPTPLRKVSG